MTVALVMTGQEAEEKELREQLQSHVNETCDKKEENGDDEDGNDINTVEKLRETAEDENEGVPVDTGFAWVITLSVFVIQTVIFGFSRCLSVLLLDISEEFDSSITVASLCFTVYTLTGSVASLVVSNILMIRFSTRTLSIAAAAASAISTGLMAISPNMITFLAMFVFKGMAFSVLLVCPTSLVGFYFKARRGMATSLANTGFCMSYIVFPPLAEFLRTTYGLRGCLLVLAAIELNLVACSMLLVPPAIFRKRYHARRKAMGYGNGSIVPRSSSNMTQGNEKCVSKTDDKYDTNVVASDSANQRDYDDNDDDDVCQKRVEESVKLISAGEHFSAGDTGDVLLSCSPKSHTSLSPPRSPVLSPPLLWNSSKSPAVGSMGQISFHASQQSLAIPSIPYFPPDLDGEGRERQPDSRKNWRYYLEKVFDTSLFKIYCYRMFLLFSVLGVFSVYLLIYMPLIAVLAGLSKADGAFFMTIMGVMDLLARLVISCVADFKWFNASKVVAFSMIVLGVACHGARIIDNYELFVAFAVLLGIFCGARQTLTSVMLMNYVGTEKFAKGFGFLATGCTLVLAMNHPIVGSLLDITGSFVIPLHYVGAFILLSALVILTEPCCKHLDEKRQKREKDAEEIQKTEATGALQEKV